jgi:hypothetical protein
MTVADVAARSRAAFAQRFPEIMTAIAAEPAQSSVVYADGIPVDIVIGDQRIYGGDARRHSAEQIAGFLKKPLRLVMETPNAGGLVSEICIELKDAMERTLQQAGATSIARGPLTAPTFLVVFGLGLGYHLEELIRRTGARWVIVVEPFPEFIGHSFHGVDWAALLERIDAMDGALHLVTDLDPGRIVNWIMRHVSQHGAPYLDGTWVFTHYPLWTFAEANKRLHGAAEFAYVNRGFFEDEIVMMTNATTNFIRHPFWLLDGKPRRHRPETVAIVGAGPSLDEAIETLHRIRDHVMLFCGGTALRPLLRHGLVPDFHCELENGPHIPEVIAEAGKHGDLSQIRLIASATVDPRTASMFRETFFFFRDTVSSTQILSGAHMPLSAAAPTCVNTAMAAAAGMGFTNFVLFGADCGLRPGTPDHAEGTIYRDVDEWKAYAAKRARYPLEVEGNFGGIAMTNWVYDACRRMLIELIATYRLKVTNCSDGALIAGATPRVPEALAIDGMVIDHERIVAEIKTSMARYEGGELLRNHDLGALRGKSRAMYDALRRVVDRFDADAADFAGVFEALSEFRRNAGDTYGFVQAIPDGSLSALPRIGMFYGCRVGDAALRRRLFETFMAELRKAFDRMETRTDELLARLAGLLAEISDLPAPAA